MNNSDQLLNSVDIHKLMELVVKKIDWYQESVLYFQNNKDIDNDLPFMKKGLEYYQSLMHKLELEWNKLKQNE